MKKLLAISFTFIMFFSLSHTLKASVYTDWNWGGCTLTNYKYKASGTISKYTSTSFGYRWLVWASQSAQTCGSTKQSFSINYGGNIAEAWGSVGRNYAVAQCYSKSTNISAQKKETLTGDSIASAGFTNVNSDWSSAHTLHLYGINGYFSAYKSKNFASRIHIYVYYRAQEGDSMSNENILWEADANIIDGTLSYNENFSSTDFSVTNYTDSLAVTFNDYEKSINLPSYVDSNNCAVRIFASVNDSIDLAAALSSPSTFTSIKNYFQPKEIFLESKYNQIEFSVPTSAATQIKIYDLTGKKIANIFDQYAIYDKKYTLKISDFVDRKGIYIVSLQSDGKIVNKKIFYY